MDNEHNPNNPAVTSGKDGASGNPQWSQDAPTENVQKNSPDGQNQVQEVISQPPPPYPYTHQPQNQTPGVIGQEAPPYPYTQQPKLDGHNQAPGVIGQPAPPYPYTQQPQFYGQNQVPGVIGQPATGYVYTQQPQTNNVIVVAQETVPDHYSLSWFVCLCCCWPIGLCAISKASEARRLVREGRLSEARAVSENARKYCIIGIVMGLIISAAVVAWRIILVTNQY